ncbi:MAG: hypothetical protein QXJ75_03750 [Candidatus Bathyarchaeia archaeon]
MLKIEALMLKPLQCRRGLGTIAGSIFFIMILIVGMNFFLWQMSQYDSYQRVLAEVNASDQERLSEDLDFQYPGVKRIGGADSYLFKIIVNNNCPLDVEIVRIYVHDKNQSTLVIFDAKSPSSTYGFEDGYIESAKFAHEIQIYSPIQLDDTHSYEFRLVTERGRVFTTIYPMPLTTALVYVQQSQVVYSHHSMKVKREGSYDWRPPYVSTGDVKSGNLYIRAVFGNLGTSPLVLSTDSVLLSQISDATANEKVFYIGGHLIDPAAKGWPGSLTIEPGATQYLYFHIDSWNVEAGKTLVFTGSAGLVGSMDGEFWSGAILMDALEVTG